MAAITDSPLLIRGAKVYSDGVPALGDVFISEGRFQHVHQRHDEESLPEGTVVIDAHGKLLLPGLVNAHTHTPMVLFRSLADDLPLMPWLTEKIWPLEAKLSPQDVYYGSLLAMAEMVRGGTTAFADMYFHMEEVAKAVRDAGLRASLCRGLTGGDNQEEQRLEEASVLAETWHGFDDGRIQVMLGPHAPYTCAPQFLERIADLGDRLGLSFHIHLAETRSEIEEIHTRYGLSPFEYADRAGIFRRPTLAAHCVHATDEDIELMAKHGVSVAHNPGSNLKLASGIAPVHKMLERHMRIALGTDGAASNNDLDMIEEMRLAAMLHKATTGDATMVDASAALDMATKHGAHALGWPDLGLILPGQRADCILVNLDAPHWQPLHDPIANFVYAGHQGDVDTVIVAGKIVMRERKLTTIDEDGLRKEIAERVTFLLNK